MYMREHILNRRGPKRWPPGFFMPGCRCCTTPYTVRQFENSSTFTTLWSYSAGNECHHVTESTDVFISHTKLSTDTVARRLDTSATLEQSFNNTTANYPTAQVHRPICFDSSGNLYINQVRNGSDLYDVAQFTSGGSKTSFASGDALTNETFRGVACDSSDNIYGISVSGFVDTLSIYKWNSSGTKQWRTTLGTIADLTSNIWVDTGGSIWVVSNPNVYRINSSGTVTTTITPTQAPRGGCSDGATGCWIKTATAMAWNNYRLYSSAGALSSSFADADSLTTPGLIGIDTSGNVYAFVRPAGTERKIRKWNSSGTTQWTGPDVGFLNSIGVQQAIITMHVTDNYVYVGGGLSQ